jgi:hypothetical protein
MIVPLAVFTIAAAVAIYVLLPLFGGRLREPDAVPAMPPQIDATADALRDLDLDWSTGKLSSADYERQRAQLLGEDESRRRTGARRADGERS